MSSQELSKIVPSYKQRGPIFDRIARTLGIDYQPPKGAFESVKEGFKIIPAIRRGVGMIMALRSMKR